MRCREHDGAAWSDSPYGGRLSMPMSDLQSRILAEWMQRLASNPAIDPNVLTALREACGDGSHPVDKETLLSLVRSIRAEGRSWSSAI